MLIKHSWLMVKKLLQKSQWSQVCQSYDGTPLQDLSPPLYHHSYIQCHGYDVVIVTVHQSTMFISILPGHWMIHKHWEDSANWKKNHCIRFMCTAFWDSVLYWFILFGQSWVGHCFSLVPLPVWYVSSHLREIFIVWCS